MVSLSFPPTTQDKMFVLGNDVINGKLVQNVKTGTLRRRQGSEVYLLE